MSPRAVVGFAAGGSAGLLLLAYLFQSLGWEPCAMCLWQRWPHMVAVLIGTICLWRPHPVLALLGASACATTAGLGIYHSGVERGWWDGPASCTSSGGGLGGLSGSDLLSTEGPALVLCDQFTPFLLGLSMANWNAIFSGFLVLFWLAAAQKTRL